MPSLTNTISLNFERAVEGLKLEFLTEADGIAAARTILQAKLDNRPQNFSSIIGATIGVGMGSMCEREKVIWLGEWGVERG